MHVTYILVFLNGFKSGLFESSFEDVGMLLAAVHGRRINQTRGNSCLSDKNAALIQRTFQCIGKHFIVEEKIRKTNVVTGITETKDKGISKKKKVNTTNYQQPS